MKSETPAPNALATNEVLSEATEVTSPKFILPVESNAVNFMPTSTPINSTSVGAWLSIFNDSVANAAGLGVKVLVASSNATLTALEINSSPSSLHITWSLVTVISEPLKPSSVNREFLFIFSA